MGSVEQIGADIDGEAWNDRSGDEISISSDGSIVAIGAINNTGGAGHVRVFKNINGSWTQLGQDIDGDGSGDQSGRSVSLSSNGNRVAIGANGNDGNGSNAGHVRIYDYDGSQWVQYGQDIDGEAINDYSGWSVSLSDNRVAIGAYRNDGNGNNSGHARVYSLGGNQYTSPPCSGCTDSLAVQP
jgi:hypothetical protein